MATLTWKIKEIEWINKVGSKEKMADSVSYVCEAVEDNHTCEINGTVKLVTESHEKISDGAYTTLIAGTGVVEKEHTEYVDTESLKTHDAVVLKTNTSGSYTAYDSLTEAKVIGWVKGKLGESKVTELETALTNLIQEDIDTGKSFKHVSSLPWSS